MSHLRLKANPPTLCNHSLKHRCTKLEVRSHATDSLAAGYDLPLLKQSLGHFSLAVTQVYFHVNPEKSSSQFGDF
ncbi:MAG: hypothetical protein ACFBSE_13460 [Prochloraceae cyanobacterium]